MNTPARQLVFGDDGSAAADVVWLWINNHRWPGWRISVVTAAKPPLGAPVGTERSTAHPWEPPTPRRLLCTSDDVEVEHLMAEADPRLVLDSFTDAGLMAIGPRGAGLLKQLGLGSTAEWLISAHRPLAPLAVIRSARPTRSVLLCVDGSLHARRATRTLARMPWITDTHVTVLGVADGSPGIERGVDDAAGMLESHGIAEVSTHVARAMPQVADVRREIDDPQDHRHHLSGPGRDGTPRPGRSSPSRPRLHRQRRAAPRRLLGVDLPVEPGRGD